MALEHDFIKLCGGREGKAYTSADDRKGMARQMARDLVGPLGYSKKLRSGDLKGRHVQKLVAHWKATGKSNGTIKNRLSVVRRIYGRLGKGHMVLTNPEYGVEKRAIRTVSRARELTEESLARIDSKWANRIRTSLKLQRFLGLRYEESVKLIPSEAIDRDGEGQVIGLRLMGSWCKNGRERRLIIEKKLQRDLLEEALLIAGGGSLIRPHRDYKQWRNHFYHYSKKAGIGDRHALRHQYAQERYTELTGRPAPILNVEEMVSEEVDLSWVDDDRAYLIISTELGHSRKQIASAYLGKWQKKKGRTA